MQEPYIYEARQKMASRDHAFRQVTHEELLGYTKALIQRFRTRKNCIALFDPDKENKTEPAFNILKYSVNWGADSVDDTFINQLDLFFWLLSDNLSVNDNVKVYQ